MPLEVLPVASNSVQRNLSQEELDRLENQRRAVMRELRIFLRDITNKLIAERKFKDFVNPVDCEEVRKETGRGRGGGRCCIRK